MAVIELLGHWFQKHLAGPFVRGRIKCETEQFRASIVTAAASEFAWRFVPQDAPQATHSAPQAHEIN